MRVSVQLILRNMPIALWKKIMELDTDPSCQALGLYGLGMIRVKQQRYAEAVDYFDRSLAFDPDFDDCREARRDAIQRINF